ncbi:hypothetical protein LK996_09590 [Lysobacter sp. A6]|uniref:Uncharacterized protein n=1 Tax=Noviluteimonas lactosilytica TaxID=2888523 RepID=A0ABS8JIE5_9GAMM|nr:hypothetical protein [Lysobacter lactosilyticus]MCC8363324.1 hypothetical protein [Lysobacter lactosilyticus]
MDRLFLDSAEVRALLHEGRTTFYGSGGSFHHPQFPPPIKRPGRAPVWFRSDIEQFAATLANACRQAHAADLLLNTSVSAHARGRRGRPRKPRLTEATAEE